MVRKGILIVICLAIFYSILPIQGAAQREIPFDAEKIAESEKIALYYTDNPEPSIIIKDKRNGFIWTSFVWDDYYDTSQLNNIWKNNVQSLFLIEYIKLDTNNFVPSESSSAELKADIHSEKIENGIRINYDFTGIKIKLGLEMRLEDDRLHVGIPIEGIDEYGDMGMVSINLLPFFGATRDGEEGYAFYPDGSGAISYFSTTRRGSMPKQSWHVYGFQEVDLDYITWLKDVGVHEGALPVFGIKKEENGYLAVMENGEHDAIIHYEPSRRPLMLNRVYGQWIYRRPFMATLSNASMLKKMEQEIISLDKEITYIFLTGEKANYSGMANAYRDLLLEKGKMSSRIEDDESIPLGLNLFMGITEERVLLNKFISMTTFQQAIDIIQELNSRNVDNMQINLVGWTKDGYGIYPSRITPHRALGGKSGLKKLSAYIQAKGYDLFLQDNYIDATKGVGGFSPQKDGVKQKNTMIATNLYSNRFLYNAQVAFNKIVNKVIPSLGRYQISGITFDRIGSMIYYDAHNQYPMTRKGTAEKWASAMEESRNTLGAVAVIGGNEYVLKYADRLMDIPSKDTGYFITDESVPFYQMVVHGSIPYSGKPINLFYDPKVEKLKMIEYGYIPHYELTYGTPEVLKFTKYNELFTSYYKDWIDNAVENYEEFNQKLGDTWNQYILKHERMLEGVYKISYENGVKVYINYRENPIKVDGYEIGGIDYMVVDGGGVIR